MPDSRRADELVEPRRRSQEDLFREVWGDAPAPSPMPQPSAREVVGARPKARPLDALFETTQRTMPTTLADPGLRRAKERLTEQALETKLDDRSLHQALDEVNEATLPKGSGTTPLHERSVIDRVAHAVYPVLRDGTEVHGRDKLAVMLDGAPGIIRDNVAGLAVATTGGAAAPVVAPLVAATSPVHEDLEGVAVQDPVMALLRAFGSATGAAIVEGVGTYGRVGTVELPNGQTIPRPLVPVIDGAGVPLHEALGGDAARGFVRAHDQDGDMARTFSRVLEKVEYGAGLDRDFGALAYTKTEGLPEQARNAASWAGWGVGMLADVFTNWEGAPVAAASKLNKARKLAGVADLDIGPANRVQSLWAKARAAFGDEVAEADHLARRAMDELVRPGRSLDDLPEPVRDRLEHFARLAGMTVDELAMEAGVDPGRRTKVEQPPAPVEPTPGVSAAEVEGALGDAVAHAQDKVSPPPPPPEGPKPPSVAKRVAARRAYLRAQVDLRKARVESTEAAEAYKGAVERFRATKAEGGPDLPPGSLQAEKAHLAMLADTAQAKARRVRELEEGIPVLKQGVEDLRHEPPPYQPRPKPRKRWTIEQARAQALRTGERHHGYNFLNERMAHPRPQGVYELRDATGAVRAEGPLDELMSRMASERRRGDNIVDPWMDSRPVATWVSHRLADDARKTEVRLTADPLFSSPDEAKLIADADVKGLSMRQAPKPRPAPETERMMDMHLGAGDLPPPPKRVEGTTLEEGLQEAFRMLFRERVGSTNLAVLGGARVLPGEARDIRRGTERAFEEAGVPLSSIGQRLKPGQKTVQVTAEESTNLARLASAYGEHGLATRITGETELRFEDWNRLQGVIQAGIGGAALRNRRLFMEAPSFTRAAAAWLLKAGAVRTFKDVRQADGTLAPVGPARRLLQVVLSSAAGAARQFKGTHRVAPPKHVADQLRNMEVELETRNARTRQVVADMAARHTDREELARELLAPLTHDLPPPSAARAADAVTSAAFHADDITPELLDAAGLGGEVGETLGERAQQLVTLKRWAKEAARKRLVFVSDWVHGLVREADEATRGRITGELANNPELVSRIHQELLGGDLSTPSARSFLVERGTGEGQLHNPATAVLGAVMRADGRRIMEETVSRLLHDGIAVPTGGRRQETISEMLSGVLDPGTRTAGELADARHTLHSWGLQPGDGADLATFGDVTLPKFWLESLERAKTTGAYSSTRVGENVGGVYSFVNRIHKHMLLTGMAHVVNTAHFMGQLVGAPWVLHLTTGNRGMSATMGVLAEHNRLVGALMSRSSNLPGVRAGGLGVDDEVLIDATGRIYHVDELEDLARRFGLFETHESFETAADASKMLNRVDGSDTARTMGSVAAAVLPPRLRGLATGPQALERAWDGYHTALREAAGVPDMSLRLAYFMSELKAGKGADAAAASARQAMYDYGDLTPTEQSWGRAAFTFYTYMRRSTGAFIKNAIRHPDRVAQQSRAFYKVFRPWGLEQLQDSLQDEGRLTLYQMDSDHTNYDYVGMQTAEAGVLEVIRGFPGMDDRPFTSNLSLPLQLAFRGMLRITGSGYDIDNLRSAMVPEWMMATGPIASPMADWLGAGIYELPEGQEHLAQASATEAAGRPAVWAVGAQTIRDYDGADVDRSTLENQMLVWSMLEAIFGRSMRTQDQQLRGAGLLEPREGRAQAHETLEAVTGLRATPIQTEEQAEFELLQQRARELGRAGSQFRKVRGD